MLTDRLEKMEAADKAAAESDKLERPAGEEPLRSPSRTRWTNYIPEKKIVEKERRWVDQWGRPLGAVMFNERGELIIAKLSRDGYKEIDRTKVIEPTGRTAGRDVVFCAPAFANKCMYVRNDKELICVSLAAE